MYELFILLAGILFVSAFVLFFEVFSEDSPNSAYGIIICLSIAMVFYFLINMHTQPQNFTMKTETIVIDTLELDGTTYKLFLPNKVKVELDNYELSLSDTWDYTVYRVFIDSVNYIEIRNSKYDSLDAKPEQPEVEE